MARRLGTSSKVLMADDPYEKCAERETLESRICIRGENKRDKGKQMKRNNREKQLICKRVRTTAT